MLAELDADRPDQAPRTPEEAVAFVVADYLRGTQATAAQFEASDASPLESLVLHIDGQGGSRARMIQFLAMELATTDTMSKPWIVVEVDALAYQREDAAARALAVTIVREALRRKARAGASRAARLAHLTRRYGRYALMACIAALLIALLAAGLAGTMLGALIAVAAVVSAAATVVAKSKFTLRWLRGRSPATRLLESAGEEDLANDFRASVTTIQRPIAVVIERLDECKPTYVVEVIETLLTRLAAGSHVSYVVPADRAWIARSYLEDYEIARRSADMFLGDTFVVSIRIPRMSAASMSSYLQEMLQPVKREQIVTPHRDDVLAAATEFLSDSSNPRELKRLVSAYKLQRTLELLAGRTMTPRVEYQILRWTLLNLRWPGLADHLAANPGDIAHLGGDPPEDIPEALRPLFLADAVRQVILDPALGDPLDVEGVRERVEI